MTAQEFFSDYWGKQPLFVKAAAPHAVDLITPEDLAGLSCEVAAARIVEGSSDDNNFSVSFGPFDEQTFEGLPAENWTLLVQEVERMDPAVNQLIDTFRCFPNWRLDDIMVSYATPGGTVGAHVDQYDVFLIQSAGTRRWEIGLHPERSPAYVPDVELRILSSFSPDRVIDVEPGDLLYLPPMFAHHGVATSECVTLSVGFRKPLVADMVGAYLSEMLSRVDPERQLGHSLTSPNARPGLLDFDSLESVRSVFRAICYDEDSIDEWFGRYITTPNRDVDPGGDDEWDREAVADFLGDGGSFLRVAVSLATYQELRGDSVRIFAMGQSDTLASGLAPVAELICGTTPLDPGVWDQWKGNDAVLDLLASLLNRGYLAPAD